MTGSPRCGGLWRVRVRVTVPSYDSAILRSMRRHIRPSRLVAAGLSVGTLIALVAAMVATERAAPLPAPAVRPGVTATPTDSFDAGAPATPPSAPAGRRAQTITSAS